MRSADTSRCPVLASGGGGLRRENEQVVSMLAWRRVDTCNAMPDYFLPTICCVASAWVSGGAPPHSLLVVYTSPISSASSISPVTAGRQQQALALANGLQEMHCSNAGCRSEGEMLEWVSALKTSLFDRGNTFSALVSGREICGGGCCALLMTKSPIFRF